jgi:ABC-type multidrug transport system ATPase subunit
MRVADRAYIMRRGVIEVSGTTAQLQGRLEEIQHSYLSNRQEERVDSLFADPFDNQAKLVNGT